MSDAFVAEIRIFPFNFAPSGWAFCNGQLIPISQNTALFSLLGTTYGGDGKSTFALPDLMGSAPMHPGRSNGGTIDHFLGERGGSATVTLLVSEIPAHTHTVRAQGVEPADLNLPSDRTSLAVSSKGAAYAPSSPQPPLDTLAPQAASVAGGSQPHNNMMPYLTTNFCIALQGVFPARP